MADSNKIKIVSEKIGEFEVVVNDNQLEKLMEEGAKTLDKIKKEEFEEGRKSRWRRPGDPFGSTDTEDGFTGNEVDWTKYFPEVSAQELDRLIKEALDHEKKIRAATNSALILIGVGISTALTGNPASALGLVKIVEILGSYFSTDNSLDTGDVGTPDSPTEP